MSNLAKWDPMRELDEFHNRLASFFGRTNGLRPSGKDEALSLPEWSPLVDITEDEHEYVIKAELPDLRKEDVKVKVDHGILSISGERKFEKEEKNKRYHRVERSYGSFVRSFQVPEDADAGKVMAEYKDGVLNVRLPKSETAKPKSIEVKIA